MILHRLHIAKPVIDLAPKVVKNVEKCIYVTFTSQSSVKVGISINLTSPCRARRGSRIWGKPDLPRMNLSFLELPVSYVLQSSSKILFFCSLPVYSLFSLDSVHALLHFKKEALKKAHLVKDSNPSPDSECLFSFSPSVMLLDIDQQSLSDLITLHVGLFSLVIGYSGHAN